MICLLRIPEAKRIRGYTAWNRLHLTVYDYLTAVRALKMSSYFIMPDEVQHWRKRSEEMRVLSEDVKDAKAKDIMLRNAEDYGRLAKYAED
jgi:hypothetical protein